MTAQASRLQAWKVLLSYRSSREPCLQFAGGQQHICCSCVWFELCLTDGVVDSVISTALVRVAAAALQNVNEQGMTISLEAKLPLYTALRNAHRSWSHVQLACLENAALRCKHTDIYGYFQAQCFRMS